MEVNDLPHTMRFGRSPAPYVEVFDKPLARMRAEEGEALMLDVTAHAHCLRPAGRRLGVRGNRRQGRRLRRRLACDQGRDRGACAAGAALKGRVKWEASTKVRRAVLLDRLNEFVELGGQRYRDRPR